MTTKASIMAAGAERLRVHFPTPEYRWKEDGDLILAFPRWAGDSKAPRFGFTYRACEWQFLTFHEGEVWKSPIAGPLVDILPAVTRYVAELQTEDAAERAMRARQAA